MGVSALIASLRGISEDHGASLNSQKVPNSLCRGGAGIKCTSVGLRLKSLYPKSPKAYSFLAIGNRCLLFFMQFTSPPSLAPSLPDSRRQAKYSP